jgi:hypothetical protein
MSAIKHTLLKTSTLGFLVIILLSCTSNLSSEVQVTALKTEYKENPVGIDNPKPRLSWKLIDNSKTREQKQTAYQILVASSLKNLKANNGDVWDSGKIITSQSTNNTFTGNVLQSANNYFWKVKIWDKDNRATKWSAIAMFTTGLFKQTDWTGEWILKEDQKKSDYNWYRKTITLKDTPTSALVLLSSFGYHELYVNGEKVTNNVMSPVSSYMKKEYHI